MKQISKTDIIDFVRPEIDRQVAYCVDKFDLGSDWKPATQLSFAKNRKHSEAGRNVLQKPFMILSLHQFHEPVDGFLEYSRYANNKIIGSIVSNDWQICASTLIAHELSHAVQFTLPVSGTTLRDKTSSEVLFYELGEYGVGHGLFFQRIYRSIRRDLINNQLNQDQIGIDPPIKVKKHEMTGTTFSHAELGKCVITFYNAKARKYPYEYMDSTGKQYKASIERFNQVSSNIRKLKETN